MGTTKPDTSAVINPIEPIGANDFHKIMKDDPFWDLMTTAIADKAAKSVEDRARAIRNYSLTLAGILFSVVSAIAAAAGYVMIDSRVATQFNALNLSLSEARDLEVQDLALVNDLAMLSTLAQLDSESEASLVEADDLVRRTVSIVDRLNGMGHGTQSDQFLRLYQGMLPISLSLAQRGRTDILAQLWAIDPGLLRTTDQSVALVATAFGREVISAAGGSEGWKSSKGEFSDEFEIYSELIGETKVRRFPEVYLQFELLREFMVNEDSPIIPDLIEEIDDLIEGDWHNLALALTQYATEDWRTEPNAETARVAEITRSFLVKYAPMSPLLSQVAEQALGLPVQQ